MIRDGRANRRTFWIALGLGLVATAVAQAVIPLPERAMKAIAGVNRSSSRTQALQLDLKLRVGEEPPIADATFDAVTFGYLLRYVDDVAACIGELTRIVRPGGVVAMVEFSQPRQPWLVPWVFYTRVLLPAAGRLIGSGWSEVGQFLGHSITGFARRYPPDRLADVLGIDVSVAVKGDKGRFRTKVVLAVGNGTKHRVVLETGGDHMSALAHDAENHQVQRVGGG